jgi:hypothetical protein
MNITSTHSVVFKKSKTVFNDCPPNKDGRTDVEVTTFKRENQIVSSFQYGKVEHGQGYSSFSFTLYQDEYGRIHNESFKRITDKMIQKQHSEAVAIFMKNKGWEVKP